MPSSGRRRDSRNSSNLSRASRSSAPDSFLLIYSKSMGSSVSMPIFIITSAQIPLSACSQYTHARTRSIIRSSREIMRNCRFSPRRIASTLPVASGSSLRFPENSIFHSMVLRGFHSTIQARTATSSPERCSLHFVPCAAQSHPLRRDGTTGFPLPQK